MQQNCQIKYNYVWIVTLRQEPRKERKTKQNRTGLVRIHGRGHIIAEEFLEKTKPFIH